MTVLVGGAQADPDLDTLAKRATEATVAKFTPQGLTADELGVAVAVLDKERGTYRRGSYRGNVPMYPASVVKLFYLPYLAHLLDRKRLRLTPELQRGVRDMIVESSNDATALILDAITGTTGGPELPPRELARWMDKRQAVNRWYQALDYTGVNACQKTWNEGPYGRERQGYGPKFERRNSLTPDACLRLMSEIALDKIVTPRWCAWMRGYLTRPIPAEDPKADVQSRDFLGSILPKGTQLWSKAGWTSEVRHDVAHIRTASGQEFVLVVFNKGHSNREDIVPFVGRELLRGLGVETVSAYR